MTEMFATMQDSYYVGDLTERQAFVTDEIKEEMEDTVIPPTQKAMLLRYIKAVCFGTYVAAVLLFTMGVLAPEFDYFQGVETLLKKEPAILLVVAGITVSFGMVQLYRAVKTDKPHYMLSGMVFALFGAGMIIFTVTTLHWTAVFYIATVAIVMWWLQYCQLWEFDIMMDKFMLQLKSEHNMYRLKARTGEEVLTQPAMGSMLNFLELRWIFGCTTHKTRERLDLEAETNEFWGNFRLKDTPENTEDQLIAAYRYATDARGDRFKPLMGDADPRRTEGYEPFRETFSFGRMMAFMEGLTTQMSWLASLAFAGLELGKLLRGESSVSETPRAIAAIFAVLTLMSFICNAYQTQNLLTTSLGLPVAEREWLAIDWMDQITDKKLLRKQVTDEMDSNRLNLTYFWLCAAACSDSWGAGVICKLCTNCALMTKLMMEEGTAFEFIGYYKARFALLIWGNVINTMQVFFLSVMAVMWFGCSGVESDQEMFWAGFVLCICFLAAGLRIREAAKLWVSMEAHNSWQNYVFGIMVVGFGFVMLVLITCLVPILLGNGNLFGNCDRSKIYSDLFPELCTHATEQNAAAYWVIVGSISVGIGLTIGAFIFGTPTVVFVRHENVR